jgi:hypothetical protein
MLTPSNQYEQDSATFQSFSSGGPQDRMDLVRNRGLLIVGTEGVFYQYDGDLHLAAHVWVSVFAYWSPKVRQMGTFKPSFSHLPPYGPRPTPINVKNTQKRLTANVKGNVTFLRMGLTQH